MLIYYLLATPECIFFTLSVQHEIVPVELVERIAGLKYTILTKFFKFMTRYTICVAQICCQLMGCILRMSTHWNLNYRHGGAYKNIKTLLRHKLVHHDSSKCIVSHLQWKLQTIICLTLLMSLFFSLKDDGYRLTNLGYDFLAIKTMTNRGLIAGVGRQIGVGKESGMLIVLS